MIIKATFLNSSELLDALELCAAAQWPVVRFNCAGLYSHNLQYDSETHVVYMQDVTDEDRASGVWRIYGADETLSSEIESLLSGS